MNKAPLHVEPEVTAGLSRGGEDLHLVFTCEVQGETLPNDFEVHLGVEDDFEGVNVERLDKDAEDKWAESDNAPYEGEVQYTTQHYEFSWQGTSGSAFALVSDKLRDAKNWRFCHHPGDPAKLRFEYRHYVGGNAD